MNQRMACRFVVVLVLTLASFAVQLQKSLRLVVVANQNDENAVSYEIGRPLKDLSPLIVDNTTVHNTTSSNTSRPWLILHVGPPKTATTTTQKLLTLYRPTLALDNFEFEGKLWGPYFDSYGPLLQGFMTHSKCHSKVNLTALQHNTTRLQHTEELPTCLQPFQKRLQEFHALHRHVVISEEVLCINQVPFRGNSHTPVPWELLRYLLADWNVRVVVTYRHYFSWLPSIKNQEDRPTPHKWRRNRWPTTERGVATLPIMAHLKRILQGTTSQIYPTPLETVRAYQEQHFDVAIWNLETSKHLPVALFCDILPNTHNACQRARQEPKQQSMVENPSLVAASWYDILATTAYSRNLVNRNLTRSFVVNATQEFATQQQQSLPVVCPTNASLQPLLQSSLQQEHDLFGTTTMDAQHIQAFYETVAKGKYCSVDRNAVLQQPQWRDFYATLK